MPQRRSPIFGVCSLPCSSSVPNQGALFYYPLAFVLSTLGCSIICNKCFQYPLNIVQLNFIDSFQDLCRSASLLTPSFPRSLCLQDTGFLCTSSKIHVGQLLLLTSGHLVTSKRGRLLWAKHDTDQCWIMLWIEQHHQQLLLGQPLVSLLLMKIISQK